MVFSGEYFGEEAGLKKVVPPMPPLETSFKQTLSCLLTIQELRDLFTVLEPCYLFRAGIPSKNHFPVDVEFFLKKYQEWTEPYFNKQSEIPAVGTAAFFLTKDISNLLLVDYGEKALLVPRKPVILLREQKIDFSREESKVHLKTSGKDTFNWGIEISFPSLYRDQECQEKKTRKEENGICFIEAQRWIRAYTQPVTILNEGKKIHTTLKIGKKALEAGFFEGLPFKLLT